MKCVCAQSLVSASYSSHPGRAYSSHPSEARVCRFLHADLDMNDYNGGVISTGSSRASFLTADACFSPQKKADGGPQSDEQAGHPSE
jgi:hypothetical protein